MINRVRRHFNWVLVISKRVGLLSSHILIAVVEICDRVRKIFPCLFSLKKIYKTYEPRPIHDAQPGPGLIKIAGIFTVYTEKPVQQSVYTVM